MSKLYVGVTVERKSLIHLTVLTPITRVTDRRMDGRTYGIAIKYAALCNSVVCVSFLVLRSFTA